MRSYCLGNVLMTGALLVLASTAAGAQQHPRDGEIHDADTKAWWHTTEALSGDDMEGRDTGSAAYQRAADYVAARFKAAGLKPAGESGGYFQTVPMHEFQVEPEGTSFVVRRSAGEVLPLHFLEDITVTASDNFLYEGSGGITFRGYCGKDAMHDIERKIVLCFGTQRVGMPSAAQRAANAHDGVAMAIVTVDDPYFSIEPPRWPAAYARSVMLEPPGGVRIPRGSRQPWPSLPSMRLSAAAFARVLAGTGQDAAAILKAGGAKQALSNFDLPATMEVKLHVTERDLSSPNVLAVLPGVDAKLKDEYVVEAAHLDGYGFGTPVGGDKLYNGTLDDAAYVALLIQMADDIKAGRLPAPKRSILFCAFTGEEKGLLGSNWFVEHPTVPKAALVADVNLDQLRPLFPLYILTAMALNESTLGATAKSVAAAMKIEVRADNEPERGLLRRADQYPFLRIHVPAISFVFGYDPGTDAERRYREWYQVRYHRPQDDLTQPVDFDAARTFDTFFYKLVDAIADAPQRPAFLPGSQFAEKKQETH
jgi:Zn-dependent M28 family amino/carboxypeptidase